MNVLAIDPGERTGWAVGTVVNPAGPIDKLRPLPTWLRVEDHGISYLRDFALALHRSVVIEDKYDVVVYENWRLRPDKARSFIGSQFPTVQLIGMIRLCAWLNPRVRLVEQTPADKTTAKRALAHPQGADIHTRLQKMPANHDDGHDGDALLHLWHWYWKENI